MTLECLHRGRFVVFLPHQMGHPAGKMLGGGSDHASEMKEAFASSVACLIDFFFSLNVCFTVLSYITEPSIEFYTGRHKAFLKWSLCYLNNKQLESPVKN